MGKSVITDLVPFIDDPSHQVWIGLTVFADDEKCCGYIFSFKDIENLGRPARVWSVVKSKCDHSRVITAALDYVGRRSYYKLFVVYETIAAIDVEVAPTVLRPRHNLQHFARALEIHLITIDDAAQYIW